MDEDSQARVLVRLLREAGHDLLTVSDAGLDGKDDGEVFAAACREDRVILTRNVRDFEALHEANAEHSGILVAHQDGDPAKNMSYLDIVRAIANIESSGWDIASQFVSLNAWNYVQR